MARITYIQPDGTRQTIEVRLDAAPFDSHGKPRSLLAAALAHEVFLEHACGGVCACSTCHVIIEQGAGALSEQQDDEADMLDMAPGLTARSRLACQSEILHDDAEIIARIPGANRNKVSEHG